MATTYYERMRDTARRLISRRGTVATLTLHTNKPVDPSRPFDTGSTTSEQPIKCIIFPDDNTTFVNHNVTGSPRIMLVAPDPALVAVNIGDTVRIDGTGEVVKIEKYKRLDPDTTGAILWTFLIK